MTHHRRLQSTLALAVATAPLFIAALAAVAAHFYILIDGPRDALSRQTFNVAHRIEAEIADYKLVAERVAELLTTKTAPSEIQELANALLSPKGQNLIIQDLQGRQTFNAWFPIGAKPGLASDSGGSVQRAKAERRTVVSDLFRGNHTADWRMAVVTPYYAPDGSMGGTVLISFDPAKLTRVIGMDEFEPGTRWVIMDSRGIMMARSHHNELVGHSMTDMMRAASLVDSGTSWTSQSLQGEPIIRSWTHLPETGWVIALVLPQSIVLNALYGWVVFYATLFSAATALTVLMGCHLAGGQPLSNDLPAIQRLPAQLLALLRRGKAAPGL